MTFTGYNNTLKRTTITTLFSVKQRKAEDKQRRACGCAGVTTETEGLARGSLHRAVFTSE